MSLEVAKAQMSLAGAVIRQAILDYKFLRYAAQWECGLSKAEKKREYLDAKDFLFSDRLEKYIAHLGLQELIDANFIRKKVTEDSCGHAIR